MTVYCNDPGCSAEMYTANAAKRVGWAILLITVGGITPRPGTVYLCPQHWHKIRPQIMRTAPVTPLDLELQQELGHHGLRARD
jgi:hypothetical protein